MVEDDEIVAGMVSYFLELQGVRCLHALTAERAWGLVAAHPPDMAVIDLRLPGKDGWWLVERIRGDQRVSRLPVVVITGSNDSSVADRAGLLGSSFLAKPFSFAELNDSLELAAFLAAVWSRRADRELAPRIP